MRIDSIVIVLGALIAAPAQAQTEIHWWHSMGGALGEKVNELASKFNASQKDYKVLPVYKGQYPESMTAAIAAFRAGNAPHILQVFEVGTATMMAARGAIVPVAKVMTDAGEPFDPKAYLPTVSGYYTDLKGNMLSFPFNSSTALFYINKDALKKAGLEPVAPKTWKEFGAIADKLKGAGQQCVYTTAWPSWVHIENFSAWHNVPIGTKQNGMGGFDAQFSVNSPLHVRHITMLGELAKKGEFTYAGRTNQGDAKFASGECALFTGSASAQAGIKKAAKFEWSAHFLPYYEDVKGAPQNSIIGGASLWVMGGKKPEDYKGVARFFTFLSDTDRQVGVHKASGYLPITKAAYAKTKESGYYKENPYLETPLLELTNKEPTENSRGLRLGNMVQLRDVWSEEIESALAGKKSAKEALDAAVNRGNAMLRQFERTVTK